MRIAAASSDGVMVNQGFGGAKNFFIYDVCAGEAKFMERRKKEPGPGEADKGGGKSLALVSDCDLVLCTEIGEGPARKLKERGTQIVEVNAVIDFILQAIASGKISARLDMKSGRLV